VLVAPHHGSKTSSSLEFLQAVSPELITISAGHLNRFGFPHKAVVERYRELGLSWLNTAVAGAISLRAGDGADLVVVTERERRRRYWMRD
jgi:competence protein ComEC